MQSGNFRWQTHGNKDAGRVYKLGSSHGHNHRWSYNHFEITCTRRSHPNTRMKFVEALDKAAVPAKDKVSTDLRLDVSFGCIPSKLTAQLNDGCSLIKHAVQSHFISLQYLHRLMWMILQEPPRDHFVEYDVLLANGIKISLHSFLVYENPVEVQLSDLSEDMQARYGPWCAPGSNKLYKWKAVQRSHCCATSPCTVCSRLCCAAGQQLWQPC